MSVMNFTIMVNFKKEDFKMKKITISLDALYNKFDSELSRGTIEKTMDGENEYYDLYVNNRLVCMDGETCAVIEETDGVVTLLNSNGEQAATFTLTVDEMKIGGF